MTNTEREFASEATQSHGFLHMAPYSMPLAPFHAPRSLLTPLTLTNSPQNQPFRAHTSVNENVGKVQSLGCMKENLNLDLT